MTRSKKRKPEFDSTPLLCDVFVLVCATVEFLGFHKRLCPHILRDCVWIGTTGKKGLDDLQCIDAVVLGMENSESEDGYEGRMCGKVDIGPDVHEQPHKLWIISFDGVEGNRNLLSGAVNTKVDGRLN